MINIVFIFWQNLFLQKLQHHVANHNINHSIKWKDFLFFSSIFMSFCYVTLLSFSKIENLFPCFCMVRENGALKMQLSFLHVEQFCWLNRALASESKHPKVAEQNFMTFFHSSSHSSTVLLMLASQRIESVMDFSGESNDEELPSKRGAFPTIIECFILSWVSGES